MASIQLDPKTLMVALTLSHIFLAIFMAFYQATQKTYPGFGMWVCGTLIMGIGALLLALRGLIPMGLSILGGNIAFPVGGVCLLQGTKRFLDLPGVDKKVWAIPMVTLVGLGYFYWVHDNPAARGIVMSLGLASLSLPMAWLLVRHAPAKKKALHYFTAFLLVLLNTSLPIRSILWLILTPQNQLFTHHASQTVYLLIAIFSQIGWTFGFVMMHGQRLEDDLRKSRSDLRAANQDLEKALQDVRQLSGLLPICARCKRIRDSQDYWHQVEVYIASRSEAEFSHSICPDCFRELYPDLADKLEKT